MDMRQRLRRLEKECAASPDGLRPCIVCASGTKQMVQVWFEGNPEPEPAICEACGRDLTFRMNFMKAVPPARPAAVPFDIPAPTGPCDDPSDTGACD